MYRDSDQLNVAVQAGSRMVIIGDDGSISGARNIQRISRVINQECCLPCRELLSGTGRRGELLQLPN